MKEDTGKSAYNLRTDKKMRQVEIADLLGVAQKDISHWESGEISSSIEKIEFN